MASIATIGVSEELRPALYKYEGFTYDGISRPKTEGARKVLVHTGKTDLTVEFDDGSLARAYAQQVWFLDSEDLFAEYDWDGLLEHLGAKE